MRDSHDLGWIFFSGWSWNIHIEIAHLDDTWNTIYSYMELKLDPVKKHVWYWLGNEAWMAIHICIYSWKYAAGYICADRTLSSSYPVCGRSRLVISGSGQSNNRSDYIIPITPTCSTSVLAPLGLTSMYRRLFAADPHFLHGTDQWPVVFQVVSRREAPWGE